MPKALCLISLVVAVLIILFFLADLGMSMAGNTDLAPLEGVSMLLDITFLVLGTILAVLSWLTFKEQV